MRAALLIAISMSIGSSGMAQPEPLARIHYESGRFRIALEVVRRDLREHPEQFRMKRIGAWCLLRLAEQSEGTEEGREALEWFDEIRDAGESDDASELGVAMANRLCAERTEDDAERTQLLDRAWSAVSALESLDRPAGVERVRILVMLGRLDDAGAALTRFVETCRGLQEQYAKTRDSTRIEGLRRDTVAQLEGIDVEVATVTMVWLDAMSSRLGVVASRRVANDLADRSVAVFRLPGVGRFLLDVLSDDPRIAPGCVLILHESADTALRVDAARTLGRLDEARGEAIPALVSALDDASSQVVAEAVTSLGLHGDLPTVARRAIEKLREHEDDGVRRRVEAVLRGRQSSSR